MKGLIILLEDYSTHTLTQLPGILGGTVLLNKRNQHHLFLTRSIGTNDGGEILERSHRDFALVGLEILDLHVFQPPRHLHCFLDYQFPRKSRHMQF